MKNRKQIAILLALSLALVGGTGCEFGTSDDTSSSSENSIVESKNDSVSSNDNESGTSSLNSSETGTDSENTDKPTDSDSDTASSSEKEKTVESITLDVTEIKLKIGETKTPIATLEPSDAEDKSEIWTSSDEKIAIVDKNGKITALSQGSCTITVTSVANPSVSKDIHVTVLKPETSSNTSSSTSSKTSSHGNTSSKTESDNNTSSKEEKKETPVTSISLSFTEKTIEVGDSVMPIVTMEPSDADNKGEIWKSSNDFIATVDKYGDITAHSEGNCIITVTSESNKDVSAEIKITVITKQEEPTTPTVPDPSSQELYIDGILIVNKTYSLPSDYNPGGLTSECSYQFELLRQGAAEDGINIYLSSGFRSYEQQKQLYNGYVSYYGQDYTDTFSARPGHSEHQTGLAIDCNIVSDYFIGTPEAIWLEEHCHEYGFIIRYPQGKEHITGYKYEPWHIRYVGVDNAYAIYESGLTLEEYFGIPSVYNY